MKDNDLAILCDIYYTDGVPVWDQALRVDVGTHDFRLYKTVFQAAKPIESIEYVAASASPRCLWPFRIGCGLGLTTWVFASS